MKKILYSLFPTLAILSIAPLAEAAPFSFFNESMCSVALPSAGINFCTVCDLLKVVENAVNYATLIVLPIGAVAIVYGGFLIMTSGGDSGRLGSGRKALWAAMIGVAITLGSWLLVNTVIQLLAQGYYASPWNEITCTSDALPPVVNTGGPPPPRPPRGSINAELAKQLLPLCAGSPTCDNVFSCTTLNETAAEQPLTVCASGCTTNPALCEKKPTIQLSTQMLQALVLLKERGFSFNISSLTTGDHGPNSAHYTGNAVDLFAVGGTSYADLQRESGAMFKQCEKSGKPVTCPTTPGPSPLADHIHLTY